LFRMVDRGDDTPLRFRNRAVKNEFYWDWREGPPVTALCQSFRSAGRAFTLRLNQFRTKTRILPRVVGRYPTQNICRFKSVIRALIGCGATYRIRLPLPTAETGGCSLAVRQQHYFPEHSAPLPASRALGAPPRSEAVARSEA